MKFHVNLVVEVDIPATTPDEASARAEQKVQALLDRYAKRLNAVVGADYCDTKPTT